MNQPAHSEDRAFVLAHREDRPLTAADRTLLAEAVRQIDWADTILRRLTQNYVVVRTQRHDG